MCVFCEIIAETFQTIAEKVVRNLHANGCNILINTGEAAGQSVKHAHVHIIPRYDENDGIQIRFTENNLDLSDVLKQIR